MTNQPFTPNEIANAMRETVGNDDWRGIPLGARYRLIKAARTLLADLAVRLDDERAADLTYDDGYHDGWDDGRLVGHYWEWGEQQARAATPCSTGGVCDWCHKRLTVPADDDCVNSEHRSTDATLGLRSADCGCCGIVDLVALNLLRGEACNSRKGARV